MLTQYLFPYKAFLKRAACEHRDAAESACWLREVTTVITILFKPTQFFCNQFCSSFIYFSWPFHPAERLRGAERSWRWNVRGPFMTLAINFGQTSSFHAVFYWRFFVIAWKETTKSTPTASIAFAFLFYTILFLKRKEMNNMQRVEMLLWNLFLLTFLTFAFFELNRCVFATLGRNSFKRRKGARRNLMRPSCTSGLFILPYSRMKLSVSSLTTRKNIE